MCNILDKIIKRCLSLKLRPSKYLLCAKIGEQKLYLFEDCKLAKTYDISSSKAPPSNVENSLGTPEGLHKIDGKIGENAPLDAVFRARKQCGTLKDQSPEELEKNLITCRIMRLRGLEEGINLGTNEKGECVDSRARFIYIHGTNQENKIGSPNSHGCLLMRNADITELFNLVPDDSLVFIEI